MIKLSLILLCLFSLPTWAQDDFEEFNARPTNQPAPQPPSGNPPPAVEVQPAPRAENNRRSRRRDNFRAEESQNFKTDEEAVFGRKTIVGEQKKEKKYVNLNPETGFGPEIIESFDPINGNKLESFESLTVYPANIFVPETLL